VQELEQKPAPEEIGLETLALPGLLPLLALQDGAGIGLMAVEGYYRALVLQDIAILQLKEFASSA
jgi:hypothetical protein